MKSIVFVLSSTLPFSSSDAPHRQCSGGQNAISLCDINQITYNNQVYTRSSCTPNVRGVGYDVWSPDPDSSGVQKRILCQHGVSYFQTYSQSERKFITEHNGGYCFDETSTNQVTMITDCIYTATPSPTAAPVQSSLTACEDYLFRYNDVCRQQKEATGSWYTNFSCKMVACAYNTQNCECETLWQDGTIDCTHPQTGLPAHATCPPPPPRPNLALSTGSETTAAVNERGTAKESADNQGLMHRLCMVYSDNCLAKVLCNIIKYFVVCGEN